MAVLTVLLVALISTTMVSLWSLLRHWEAFLWWGVLIVASWGQGSWLLGKLTPGLWQENRSLRGAMTLGLGLGLLSIEVLLVGLAGFFSTRALTLFVILLVILSYPALRRTIKKLALISPKLDHEAYLPAMFISLGVLLTVMLSLVPPVFFDTMTYHLELPARYLQEGRIFHVTENLYSGYPHLTEILYGLGLAVEGVALPGLLSVTFLILVIFLAWGWGKDRFSKGGASWGVAILVLMPPYLINVGFLKNGWVTAFFILAPLVVLCDGDRSHRVMALAGIMAGLAAGCKYNALAFGFGVPMAAGVMDDLLKKEFSPRPWFVFLVSAVIVASPWYLKNLVFTGDPLFPLLAGMSGKVPGLGILVADTHLHSLSLSYLWEWVTIPYIALFHPWELQLAMSPGILPVILLPTLWSLRGSRTSNRYIGLWALIFFVIWYFSFRSGRFLLPLIALGCLYLGCGFYRATGSGRGWGLVMRGVVSVMLLLNVGTLLAFEERYASRTGAAFGVYKDEQYLQIHYPLYPAISFLNHLEPAPGKVLFLGEMKGFYSDFDREVATFEVPNRLIEMIRRGETGVAMARDLSGAGFTHILFNSMEIKRLAVKSPFLRLDDREAELLSGFLSNNTRMLFEENEVYVFEIRNF
jgi:hypothetical protein